MWTYLASWNKNQTGNIHSLSYPKAHLKYEETSRPGDEMGLEVVLPCHAELPRAELLTDWDNLSLHSTDCCFYKAWRVKKVKGRIYEA